MRRRSKMKRQNAGSRKQLNISKQLQKHKRHVSKQKFGRKEFTKVNDLVNALDQGDSWETAAALSKIGVRQAKKLIKRRLEKGWHFPGPRPWMTHEMWQMNISNMKRFQTNEPMQEDS